MHISKHKPRLNINLIMNEISSCQRSVPLYTSFLCIFYSGDFMPQWALSNGCNFLEQMSRNFQPSRIISMKLVLKKKDSKNLLISLERFKSFYFKRKTAFNYNFFWSTRPVVITIFTCVVCTFVLSKSHKTKQISRENSDRYWRDCGSGRVDHWWHSCIV